MKKAILIFMAGVFTVMTASAQNNQTNKMDQDFLSKQPDGIYAKFHTAKGDIYTALEYKKTPLTVANFVGLVEGKMENKAKPAGTPFYDGLKFHRVISKTNGDAQDFMIQGGDPQGTGVGGPGYSFADEFDESLKHTGAGILSMANSGPATNGSQFFITLVATPWLDGKHTIFGNVVEGLSVVNAIKANDVMETVTILRKGSEATAFDAVKTFKDVEVIAAKKIAEADAARMAAAEAMKSQYPNVTPSGLRYIVLTEGTGAKPLATSNVKVHYTGTFLDGKVFDSSVQRGTPIDFGLNQVIPGWTEGVQLMKEGGKYKFFIPYQLAYGEQGYPGAIPPKSDLIFEVELIKINQ